MHSVKINNFEKENGEGSFPTYRRLNCAELSQLKSILSANLNLNSSADGRDILSKITESKCPLLGINTLESSFSLRNIICNLGFAPSIKVYVNWDDFREVDEIGFDDITNYFSDIWYPSSDDIEIIDKDLKWIVSIDHMGGVSYLVPRHPTSISQ